jgi:hypothetical protein
MGSATPFARAIDTMISGATPYHQRRLFDPRPCRIIADWYSAYLPDSICGKTYGNSSTHGAHGRFQYFLS